MNDRFASKYWETEISSYVRGMESGIFDDFFREMAGCYEMRHVEIYLVVMCDRYGLDRPRVLC